MSLTATNSSSVPASYAARKRLRPIRPKPLIATFTFAMRSSVESRLPATDRDLDPVTVRVEEVRRVVAATVLRPRPGRAVVGAPRVDAALPGCLDRRDPVRGEADMAAAGALRVSIGREEHRAHDPPGDLLVRVYVTPPAERAEHRVVEAAAALEIGGLDADVVDHPRDSTPRKPLSGAARSGPPRRGSCYCARGVQRKKRIASSSPAIPQMATIASWSHSNPAPVVLGSKAV